MESKLNIIIFGTGKGAEMVLDILDFNNVNIVAFIDNDEKKQGDFFNNIKIDSPSNISDYKFDYIIIGSISYKHIIKSQLISLGVPDKMIIAPLNKFRGTKIKYYKRMYEKYLIYDDVFTDTYNKSVFNDNAFSSINYQYSQKRSIFIYDYPDYLLFGVDYVRVSTVEMLSKEIIEKNIEGSIAELGVYKGHFTKLLSSLFTKRRLYLFDTFEGFKDTDVATEKQMGFSKAKQGHLGDTNIEIVLEKIQPEQEVVVKKGYFPETTKDLQDEKFAFVSIDVDLYKPTYEGLHYFYERLSKGGYILVHDYNFDTYKGVKEAVRQFSNEKNVSYVPLSDYFGSVIISK